MNEIIPSFGSWFPYQVFCNGHRIASFVSETQARNFVKERARKYRDNQYTLL